MVGEKKVGWKRLGRGCVVRVGGSKASETELMDGKTRDAEVKPQASE